ncbi:hypothetical protein IZ6_10970 [Terrihabitans soli]|uniref:Uncharacterized protein n=1 Tax=Terrihabitans soli TaxID=708113 RepID=A0A6S6QSX4_9HYPH|nr:hypothetical protein [Terrihabitans soli]BCJ90362.1 hypothetical protein IZ6_10970 [Terrihabitans soli]
MADLPPPPPPQADFVNPNTGRPTEIFYLWLVKELVTKIRELEARIAALEP